MSPIVIRFPTEEEEDLVRRFTVNKNYVQGLATFLSETYGQSDRLYAGLQTAIVSRPAYTKIQRVGTVDPYLVADIPQGAHQTFNRSLATVVAATACLLEVYVARRIGKEQFGRAAREFVRQD